MHIPNGFLDIKTTIATFLLSGSFLTYALKKSKETLKQKYIPLTAVTAAFIFAAQMINFPVAPGTSGHFLGSAFAILIAGPINGSLIMCLVVILQSLIFQDGGLLALGANILNMGIIGTTSAYFVYKFVNKLGNNYIINNLSIFLASLFSVVLVAIAVSIELAISNTVSLKTTLPLMTGFHIIVGFIEGIITVSAMSLIKKIKPTILATNKGVKNTVVYIIAIISIIIILFAPFASISPDTLEKVSMVKGFNRLALANYQLPFIKGNFSTIIFGLIGVVAVSFIAYGSFLVLKKGKT